MATARGLSGYDDPVQFTQPVRQVVMMLIVLGLVGAAGYLIYPSVAPVFLANPWLNGVIFAVFIFGVLACFWQIIQLSSSVSWIRAFAEHRPGLADLRAPRLVASLAALLRDRGSKVQISSSSARSLLDSVAIRMDEVRDITRYIINLLIFLGLLGTFYGLATTIPAVVDTIRSLEPQEGDSGVEVFSRLMSGLEDQLAGMGTAFSSSLLGLAGSLVVGLLELFAGHGQNRFYREMEDWLSTITKVGFAAGDGDGGGFDQGVVATVLDHMVEQIDSLEDLFAKSQMAQNETNQRISHLTESMEGLTRRIESHTDPSEAVERVVAGQDRLIALLSEHHEGERDMLDAETKMRLRSIDTQVLRMLEELTAGRQETVDQLHRDLTALTQAVRAGNRAEYRPSNIRSARNTPGSEE